MFHFLNPSILFALTAAFIPLLIHLFNRRKFKEIKFSTIHFLKEMVRKEMRRLRIRQLLLLLIRTLIIILVVMAFARPTLQSSGGFAAGRSATEVVFVIDNSLSLNSLQLTGNLLESVRQWWLNLEPLLQMNDRLTVILGTEPQKILAEREYYSPELWKKINKNIQPVQYKGNLQLATLKALEIFQKSELSNKELYYLSDFQISGINEQELQKYWQEFPARIRIYLLPVIHGREDNISIDSALVLNQLLEKNQFLQLRTVLHNQTADKHLNSMVSLIVQNSRIAQQNLSIPSSQTKVIQFETISQSSGYQAGFVECENDALMEDNRYYFNFFIPEKIKIIHLVPQMQFQSFIPTILQAAVERDLFIYEKKTFQDWPSVNLDDYEAVILEGFTDLSDGLINRLKQFNRSHKGLILIPGENLAIQNINNFLSSLEVGRIISRQGNTADDEKYVSLGRINWVHPIFESLFTERKELNPIHVYSYYQMQPNSSSDVIIELQNGQPFLLQGKKEAGPLFLLASSLQPEWTNLVVRGLVVPLFYRMIYYAVTQNVSQRLNIRVGEKFTQVITGVLPPYQFTLKKPSGLEEKITPGFRGADLYLQLDQNDEAGNYQVWQSDRILLIYSVNHPVEESIQQYYQPADIQRAFPGALWIDPSRDVTTEIEKSRYGLELWSYFIVLAILLIFCEMIISYTTSKKQKEIMGQEFSQA
ncbi:MAG: hypothetical protein A2Y94_15435 [Caldithrix sp. RBG_13_44_9]|nr:MAG: hypothetical protein A2Y94_15435 [Caldithrix sp. RBG_13_44_9]